MVEVNLHLFGKPAWELGCEGEPFKNAEVLRGLGDSLQSRLHETADILDKLIADGWEPQMTLYDIACYKPKIKTEEQAKARLVEIGVDPERVCIMDFDDDWDEYEDEELDEESSVPDS